LENVHGFCWSVVFDPKVEIDVSWVFEFEIVSGFGINKDFCCSSGGGTEWLGYNNCDASIVFNTWEVLTWVGVGYSVLK
jgi:hypothetical protein